VARGRRIERLHVTLPENLLRALEVRRQTEGMYRSEAIEEAVRLWLAEKDEEDLARREGLGAKLEDLEELVLTVRERLGDLAVRNLYASERVYALLEGQFSHNLRVSRQQTHRTANERIGRMRKLGGSGEEA
jgi:Arc/MetJ-type ribon-helix-helix transcriptional regulator